MKQNEIVVLAKNAIKACLDSIPSIKYKILQKYEFDKNKTADFWVEIRLKNRSFIWVIELKKSGQPRIAREAINNIQLDLQYIKDGYGVLIAPYITKSTKQICSDFNVGYIDLSGNCQINFDNVFIDIEGKPNKFSENRILKSLYSPKAERVLRILLSSNKRWFVQDLANKANVSIGLTSNIKQLLFDKEYIKKEGYKFWLSKPKDLLYEWSENYNYRKNKIYQRYSILDIDLLEKRIVSYCNTNKIRYALAGFSAAKKYASFVSYNRIMIYITNMIKEIDISLDLKPVNSGANLFILEPYDEGVYLKQKEYEGINLTSPIQTFLDLKTYRGRGEEAANHLFEEVIEQIW